jgi:hypothetical protein
MQLHSLRAGPLHDARGVGVIPIQADFGMEFGGSVWSVNPAPSSVIPVTSR